MLRELITPQRSDDVYVILIEKICIIASHVYGIIHPIYRDSLLAILTTVVLLSGGILFFSEWRIGGVIQILLVSPRPAVAGVIGALAIEVVCLRNPDRTQAVWGRRSIRVGSVSAVLAVGGIGIVDGAVWVLTMLLWGLFTYFVLAIATVMTGNNPLVRLGV
jgi:hypothetical protein